MNKREKTVAELNHDTYGAIVGYVSLILAFFGGIGSALAWMSASNDSWHAKELSDIDPTPGLYWIGAVLCGVVVMLEMIRRELVFIRRQRKVDAEDE